MLLLDLILRGASIGLLALLAGLLWRAPIGWEGRLPVLAVALSKGAMLLTTAAMPLDLPRLVTASLTLLGSLTPAAVTWLIVAIFLDRPGLRWPWLAAGASVSALLFLNQTAPNLSETATFSIGCAVPAALLYGALVVLSLWSSRDDLVECRCSARPYFAAAIAGLGLLLTGVQALGFLPPGSQALALLQSTGVLAVTVAFAVWILSPRMDLWPGLHDHRPPPSPGPDATTPDIALIARIRAAMAAGIWREEGLTIGALAGQLRVPEHRLRRAINGGLGHRNFSSFVNSHRIAAAKSQLADPEAMGTTVLEIAFDVGFASLGPFNRAFRAETGQSPTEFRAQALARPIRAETAHSAPIPANLH